MEISLNFVVLLSCLIVVALVLPWLVRWISHRRHIMIKRQRTFVIQDVFMLEPKKKLCVFDYDRARYVVILGPQSDTLIDVRPLQPELVHAEEPAHAVWKEPRL